MKCPFKSKDQYHHGDLKHGLTLAALQLIRESGPDRFSMTDACKVAGVSKAAPYRHFANKDDLLRSVIEHGFTMLSADVKDQSKGLVPGSNERIIAIGMAYVNFGIKEPDLFKLMFGKRTNECELDEEVEGRESFQLLLDEIIARTKFTEIAELMAVAFPLWTLVHGAATLTIDRSYERIYPDNDTELMISQSTEMLLARFPEPAI